MLALVVLQVKELCLCFAVHWSKTINSKRNYHTKYKIVSEN